MKTGTRTARSVARGKDAAAHRGPVTAARRTVKRAPARKPGAAAARPVPEAPRRGWGAAVLALALAAAWAGVFLGAADPAARVWRGYQTLLVRHDIAASGGVQKLVTALGPGVVSGLTATVDFWDFTGVQGVAVAGIDSRIDPSDPRHDPTMDAVPRYFQSPSGPGGWSIAYIPSRRAALVDYLGVAAVLGLPFHGEWRMVGFDALELLVAAAGMLALAALLAWPFTREGRTRLLIAGAGALLWIPFLFPGGAARTSLALLLYASWFQIADVFIDLRGSNDKLLRAVRDPLARFLAAAGVGLVLLFAVSGSSSSGLAGCAVSLGASLLLVVALALFWGRAPRQRGRRKKFDPVPIVKSATAPAAPGQAGFLLVFLVILASAGLTVSRNAPVPTPVAAPGIRDYSWESLALLSRQPSGARLPDISDFVTHEAFQQALAFGRPWKLPGRDERVYVREFVMNDHGGPVVEGLRTVKVFDSPWLDSVTSGFPPGSIEGLLAAQGRPIVVAFRGQVNALLREVLLAVIVLFVFSAWFVREKRAAPLMKSVLVRLNGPARRNQIP